ncbi:type II secretion system F family protein [Herminiimonas sp. CN]|uniref:type II secretion system F family protein n=1 Tax=Herminiimonas sp. CN TaxID=1349818 RepID=UPI00047320C1|nr:type II secretion system F family protein [Herminiimonas sp. CN]
MSSLSMIFLVVVFLAVFGFAFLMMRYLMPTSVQQRLQQFTADAGSGSNKPANDWVARIAKLSSPLAKLSVPDEGWENSALRVRFMNAGFRSEHAQMIYFGAKTLLAIAAPLLVWLALLIFNVTPTTNTMLMYLLLASAIGLYLPNIVLGKMVQARQLAIFENFPNALDLMTVCIEAGLAIDAAIARVAQEMASSAPAVSEELHLVTLELRAGNSKEKALRNLAMRTGVEDVETLVSMLIQAERFGTSIADSLRVHAEGLRIKRRQKAEETAAKISVKLLFPLIFCIFPALMLVLLGPAMIQMYRVLLPTMTGGGQ